MIRGPFARHPVPLKRAVATIAVALLSLAPARAADFAWAERAGTERSPRVHLLQGEALDATLPGIDEAPA